MYRYSQQVRNNVANRNWRRRFINILLIILLLVSILFITLYVNASSKQNRYIEKHKNQIVFEIGQANSQMNTLSRTGGSGTSNLLGKIRQRIYAIEVLENQYNATFGSKSYTNKLESMYKEIYLILDQFDEALIAGKTTKDVQNNLSEKISALQTEILTMVAP